MQISGHLNKQATISLIAKTGIRKILRKDGLPIVSILLANDLSTNITFLAQTLLTWPLHWSHGKAVEIVRQ